MLQVPIDKIIPVTKARANISKIVTDVEKGDIYVLTRGGKPSVIVSSVGYIQKLNQMNNSSNEIAEFNGDKNNNLVTKEEADNLPAKIKKNKKEIVEEKTEKNEVKLNEQKNEDIAVQDTKNDEDNQEEEQAVPVKVASAKWNQ